MSMSYTLYFLFLLLLEFMYLFSFLLVPHSVPFPTTCSIPSHTLLLDMKKIWVHLDLLITTHFSSSIIHFVAQCLSISAFCKLTTDRWSLSVTTAHTRHLWDQYMTARSRKTSPHWERRQGSSLCIDSSGSKNQTLLEGAWWRWTFVERRLRFPWEHKALSFEKDLVCRKGDNF